MPQNEEKTRYLEIECSKFIYPLINSYEIPYHNPPSPCFAVRYKVLVDGTLYIMPCRPHLLRSKWQYQQKTKILAIHETNDIQISPDSICRKQNPSHQDIVQLKLLSLELKNVFAWRRRHFPYSLIIMNYYWGRVRIMLFFEKRFGRSFM